MILIEESSLHETQTENLLPPVSSSKMPTSDPSSFLTLPSEIHHLISTYLPYPDLLSLTLTHPLFQSHQLIRTTKSSRVNWLIDRSFHKLPLPSRTRCRWSSDNEFVNNHEIKEILRRRRWHAECAEYAHTKGQSSQCLVVEGRTCEGVKEGGKPKGLRGWVGLKSAERRRNRPWQAWQNATGTMRKHAWQTLLAVVMTVVALVWNVV